MSKMVYNKSKKRVDNLLDKMLKNKTRLALKMFIILWFLLFFQVILKLTFNYWQPYVIPTPQLERISDFIDDNLWLKIIINKILWFIGTYFMILSGIQQWKFKNKKIIIILIVIGLISFINDFIFNNSITIIDFIISIFTLILLPIIINKKKWLTIILTFVLSYVFLFISLWLEGFSKTDDMQYLIRLLFNFDYYIMLVLNYILFNLIRIRKENKNNG